MIAEAREASKVRTSTIPLRLWTSPCYTGFQFQFICSEINQCSMPNIIMIIFLYQLQQSTLKKLKSVWWLKICTAVSCFVLLKSVFAFRCYSDICFPKDVCPEHISQVISCSPQTDITNIIGTLASVICVSQRQLFPHAWSTGSKSMSKFITTRLI